MEILEAAMAFAVAMIIFSTIVTGIVELINRLLRTRKRYLLRSVDHLFDDVVWPALFAATGMSKDDAAARRLRDTFCRDMVVNPVGERFAFAREGERADGPRGKFCVESLSTLSFAERLARTDVGRAILAAGEARMELLVTDFARTFERFGRAASEQMQQRSRITAVVVGIVFALAANLDAGRLMTALLDNAQLRGELIARADTAFAESEAATRRLSALLEAAPGSAERDDLAQIGTQMAAVQQRIDDIRTRGLPVGYDHYPYAEDTRVRVLSLEFLRWVLLCVLAGVLGGLGSPFWFAVFSRLSQLVSVLRSLRGDASGDGDARADGAPVKADESARPRSVLDAFLVAAQVHAGALLAPGLAAAAPVRPILEPDGRPLGGDPR